MLSLRPWQAHGFLIKPRGSLGRHRTGWQTLAPLFRRYRDTTNHWVTETTTTTTTAAAAATANIDSRSRSSGVGERRWCVWREAPLSATATPFFLPGPTTHSVLAISRP